MSILIKGMEMPKNCGGCFLRFGQCSRRIYMENRPSDCPLIPVQPHGRLIDADALELDSQKRLLICDKNDNQFQKPYEVIRAIELAPTVIPAEESE